MKRIRIKNIYRRTNGIKYTQKFQAETYIKNQTEFLIQKNIHKKIDGRI